MFLGDPRKFYKHPDELDKMMSALLEDYAEWNKEFKIDDVGIDVGERYITPKWNKHGMMTLPVIDARTIHPDYSKGWERSMDQAFKIPGMLDMCINFIRPGKMLPVHHDGYVWGWIRQSFKDQSLTGYTVSFGVDIPEPEKQALVFDGRERVWGTGEFRAFNGENTVHYLKNEGDPDSENWRVTAVMEIEESFWDV